MCIRSISIRVEIILLNNPGLATLYPCSVFERTVHRGIKVIVEVPNMCMIVFTNISFHIGIKSYKQQGGNYMSHLRLFACIVENKYVLIKDEVLKLLKNNECILTCDTYESMVN